MPHLRIIYDEDGWAYHHRARALRKYAPPDFEVSLARLRRGDSAAAALGAEPVDVVFVLPHQRALAVLDVLRQRRSRAKLVASCNVGWPLDLPLMLRLARDADAVIMNNEEYWDKTGRRPGTHMIPNGVDLGIFRVTVPLTRRPRKVLWTGSVLHRRIKGYDDLIVPLRDELRRRQIDCDVLLVESRGDDKRTAEGMAEWYNTGSILVCASQSEGTPNSALEAAASGCTLVSTRVGNMPQLIRHGVNGYLVDRNLPSVVRALDAALTRYLPLATRLQEDIQSWHWAARSAEFFAVFRSALAAPAVRARGRRSAAPLDLSDRVTVFVSSIGAPSYAACLDHLGRQDCTFTLKILHQVAPSGAAVQCMVDECRTEYFVHVDDTMLLRPHAIRALYDGIARTGPNVAMCAGSPDDVRLARYPEGEGIKIFRHDVVRRSTTSARGP